MIKKILSFVILVLLFSTQNINTNALISSNGTDLSNTISVDTTLTSGNYFLSSDLTINSGITLTINDGVTLEGNFYSIYLDGNSTINFNGLENNKINIKNIGFYKKDLTQFSDFSAYYSIFRNVNFNIDSSNIIIDNSQILGDSSLMLEGHENSSSIITNNIFQNIYAGYDKFQIVISGNGYEKTLNSEILISNNTFIDGAMFIISDGLSSNNIKINSNNFLNISSQDYIAWVTTKVENSDLYINFQNNFYENVVDINTDNLVNAPVEFVKQTVNFDFSNSSDTQFIFDSLSNLKSESDTTLPKLEEIIIGDRYNPEVDRYIDLGEEVSFYTRVSDVFGSGIKFVNWKYFFPNKENFNNLSFFNIYTNLFDPVEFKEISTSTTLDSTYPSGLYEFEHISIVDYSGNHLQLNNTNFDISDLSFCFNCIHLTSINIIEDTIFLNDNNTFQKPTYEFLPVDATDTSIVLNSENESIAKIENGFIVGVSNGTTTITATNSISGITDTVEVNVDFVDYSVLNGVTPVCESFKIDKQEAKLGDIVKIAIKLSPNQVRYDTAGILLPYGDGTPAFPLYVNGNHHITDGVELNYDETTDTYIKNLLITEDFLNGKYWVYKSICIEPNNVWFNINNSTEGINWFDVKNVEIDKSTVTEGDYINFKVDIQINGESSDYYSNGTTNFDYEPFGRIYIHGDEPVIKNVYLAYNESKQTLEGNLLVDSDYSNGIWTVDRLEVGRVVYEPEYDYHLVSDYILSNNPLVNSLNFNVTGNREADTELPDIKSIEIDLNTVSPNDKVKISIDLYNNEIQSYTADIGFSNNSGNYDSSNYLSTNLIFNPSTNKLEGEIDINSGINNSSFEPDFLSINGNHKNILRVYNFDKYNLNFNVINATDSSLITNATVSLINSTKKNVQNGDIIYFSMDIENYSQLNYGCSLKLKGPMSDMRSLNVSFNGETNEYSGIFAIDSFMSNGEWKIIESNCVEYNDSYIEIPSNLILNDTLFTVSNNIYNENLVPNFTGVENHVIYSQPVTINFSNVKVQTLPGYTLTTGYTFDRNGFYHLSITDNFGNYRSIDFGIILKEETSSGNNSNSSSDTTYTYIATTPTISTTPKLNTPSTTVSPQTFTKRLDSLKELFTVGAVTSIDKETVNAQLKSLCSENKNFVSSFTSEEKDSFETFLQEVYEDNLNIEYTGLQNINIKGLLLNTNLEVLTSGESISYKVDIKEELTEEDKPLVDQYMNDQQLDTYNVYSLDINISELIGDSERQITELEEPIILTLPLPDSFKGLDNLQVVHVHNGQVEVLEVTINGDGTFSFSTNKLSSFTLVQNTPKTSPINEETQTTSNVWLYGLGILLIAGLGFGYKKLRKN